MPAPAASHARDILRFGARASLAQCVLFYVIAICAWRLGIERFAAGGLPALLQADRAWFASLCAAFVAIAVLGIAITPAEHRLLAARSPALAGFGARLALTGHAGTIAFFGYWLILAVSPQADAVAAAGTVMPAAWGVAFELVLVGAWVWIIAWIARRPGLVPRGFVTLSVFKAACFWTSFAAFLANEPRLLFAALGATLALAGPAWHGWIAKILLDRAGKPA